MRVPGLVKRFPDGLNLGRRHSGAKAGSLRSADTRHSQKSSATTISIAKNEGLRRFLIFALLGPPLGMITRMWGILPVLNWSLGDAAVIDYHQIVLMPLAYRVGVLPALLAAAFDGWLAKRENPIPRRLVRAVRLRGELSSAARRAVDGIPARAVRGDFRFAGAAPRLCSWLSERAAAARRRRVKRRCSARCRWDSCTGRTWRFSVCWAAPRLRAHGFPATGRRESGYRRRRRERADSDRGVSRSKGSFGRMRRSPARRCSLRFSSSSRGSGDLLRLTAARISRSAPTPNCAPHKSCCAKAGFEALIQNSS